MEASPRPFQSAVEDPAITSPSVRLYLRLLQRCLIREIFPDQRYQAPDLVHKLSYSPELRENGLDWPTEAETMVGRKRLNNLRECCISAIQRSVPGDFVETGTWRGGCGILMRALLEAFGDRERKVWLFDSFEGLPKPDPESFPVDKGDQFWTCNSYLGVSLEQVRANFQRYELLDERVRMVKGWFRDTVPNADIGPISVLRLDGDMYESTWLVLKHFYPKLSPGGFIIIDDYGAVPSCKAAVDDFRQQHSIVASMTPVDWTGVFWQKRESEPLQDSSADTSCDVLQLHAKYDASQAQYAAAMHELGAVLAERDGLQSRISGLQSRLDELQSRLEQAAKEFQHEIASWKERLDAERAIREAIEHSKSWRLTEPLRRIMAALRASR